MKGGRRSGLSGCLPACLPACMRTVYLALADGALAEGGGGNPVHYLDLQL